MAETAHVASTLNLVRVNGDVYVRRGDVVLFLRSYGEAFGECDMVYARDLLRELRREVQGRGNGKVSFTVRKELRDEPRKKVRRTNIDHIIDVIRG